MKRGIFLTVLLSLSTILSNAQTLQFVKSDMNSVSSGMGGTSSVYTKTAYTAFNNIASLPFSDETMDFALSYYDVQPKGTHVRGSSLGGAIHITDALGISAAFSGGIGSAYDIIDMDGNIQDSFIPSEYLLSIGASYKLASCLSVGINAGYAGTELAEGKSYGAFVSDIFVMSEFHGARFTLGLSDIGTPIKSVNGSQYMLPTSIVAGAGYTMDWGNNHRTRVAAECSLWYEYKVSASVGASYSFYDILEIRAGYRYRGKTIVPSYCSAGMGLKIAGISLDFSYILPVFQNRLSGTWSVGLSFTICKNDY